MKIKDNQECVKFCRIDSGKCFQYCGEYFMKLSRDWLGVGLKNGNVVNFGEDTEVRPVEAEVTIL